MGSRGELLVWPYTPAASCNRHSGPEWGRPQGSAPPPAVCQTRLEYERTASGMNIAATAAHPSSAHPT